MVLLNDALTSATPEVLFFFSAVGGRSSRAEPSLAYAKKNMESFGADQNSYAGEQKEEMMDRLAAPSPVVAAAEPPPAPGAMGLGGIGTKGGGGRGLGMAMPKKVPKEKA